MDFKKDLWFAGVTQALIATFGVCLVSEAGHNVLYLPAIGNSTWPRQPWTIEYFLKVANWSKRPRSKFWEKKQTKNKLALEYEFLVLNIKNEDGLSITFTVITFFSKIFYIQGQHSCHLNHQAQALLRASLKPEQQADLSVTHSAWGVCARARARARVCACACVSVRAWGACVYICVSVYESVCVGGKECSF